MSSEGIVIAGGGLAAQRCAETLRARGYDGRLRLVCAEERPPYDRPPLSKEVLAGERPASELALRPEGWHPERDVELLLGRRAAGLDAAARRLELDDGSALRYDRLLVATGGRPRRLAGLEGHENVHVLRDDVHAERLRSALGPGVRLTVVGAGLIGLEVAATARGRGAEVTVLEACETPLAAVLGPRLGAWFSDLHVQEGVDLRCGVRLESVRGSGRVEELALSDGRRIACDVVVVGIGMEPDADWLAGSGLDPKGVAIDAGGRTALPGVFAAGDLALPPDPATGRPARADHWESAVRTGSAAALTMLGLPLPAPVPAGFWTDQYGIRVQVVGRPADADSIEFDGDPAGRDFSASLLRRGRLVAGVAVARARALAVLRRALTEEQNPETEAA